MARTRISNVLLMAALLVASGALVSAIWRYEGPDIFAKRPEVVRPAVEASAPDPDDLPNTFGGSQPIVSAKPGDPVGYTRIAAPSVEPGARRIGIQIGHWQTDNVPPELRRLEIQTGTSWGEYTEVGVASDIAVRVGETGFLDAIDAEVGAAAVVEGKLVGAFVHGVIGKDDLVTLMKYVELIPKINPIQLLYSLAEESAKLHGPQVVALLPYLLYVLILPELPHKHPYFIQQFLDRLLHHVHDLAGPAEDRAGRGSGIREIRLPRP